ncbi:hypothetical protein [Sodalis sp. dw_96]|uniref:hypothetical protein n=1 Tax=Sodalis sp. dw_96 TaxID=2719794 RepID=UPI001BD51724|nr:hypothetical protein [Sodalis sp. dw_96]
MIRFLCCRNDEASSPDRHSSTSQMSKVATGLTTVSNHIPLSSFTKKLAGNSEGNNADNTERRPARARSLEAIPESEGEYRPSPGYIAAITTYPGKGRLSGISICSRSVVNRQPSFNADKKNAAAMDTPVPSGAQALAPTTRSGRPLVKRTVSFNLPADVARDKYCPAASPKIDFQYLWLLRSLDRNCTGPAIMRLLGTDDNPGKVSVYKPLKQLRMLKTMFQKSIIDDLDLFDSFFQRTQQIANQWSKQPIEINEISGSGSYMLDGTDLEDRLEMPVLIKTREAFQLQGELWLKFCKEMFIRIRPERYAMVCTDIFIALKPLWHEYQLAITRLILIYFSYIPQKDNLSVFLTLARLCEPPNGLHCYEHIRMLAQNIIYLDKKNQFGQVKNIKKLSAALHKPGNENIQAILCIYRN